MGVLLAGCAAPIESQADQTGVAAVWLAEGIVAVTFEVQGDAGIAVSMPGYEGKLSINQAAGAATIELAFLENRAQYELNLTDATGTRTIAFSAPPANPVPAISGPLGPGIEIRSAASNGSCTLGFLARDAVGNRIAMAAGHCVEGARQVFFNDARAPAAAGNVLGEVVHLDIEADFALIQIDARADPFMSDQVIHWGGPTGVLGRDAWSPGDAVCLYGMATPTSFREETRARCGPLHYYTWQSSDAGPPIMNWVFEISTFVGDSGSPFIHHGSGSAAGLLLAGSGAIAAGVSMCSVIERAVAAGHPIQIQGPHEYLPQARLPVAPVAPLPFVSDGLAPACQEQPFIAIAVDGEHVGVLPKKTPEIYPSIGQ